MCIRTQVRHGCGTIVSHMKHNSVQRLVGRGLPVCRNVRGMAQVALIPRTSLGQIAQHSSVFRDHQRPVSRMPVAGTVFFAFSKWMLMVMAWVIWLLATLMER